MNDNGYVDNNGYKMNYLINNIDSDFKLQISPAKLLFLFEQSSAENCSRLKVDFEDIADRKLAWLLTNFYYECYSPAHYRDRVLVETWPVEPKRVICERDFRLSCNGEVKYIATSRWCLFNIETRRVVASNSVDWLGEFKRDRIIDAIDWSITDVAPNDSADYSVVVGSSWYDRNRHLNNTVYVDFAFNCFSVEFLKNNTVKNVKVGFINQCFEGDKLDYYKKQIEPCVYLISAYKNGVEIAFKARIEFYAN